jgi:DNA-binding response OmpR family regulator
MRNLVLFAHPEVDRQKALTRRLEGLGYHCLTATTGAEALAAVMQYAPQMVIAHAELPEIQGTEVCLRLKQDPETEAIAFVLIATDSAEDRFVGSEVGADAYMVEPVEPDVLCKKVGELFITLQLNAKSLLKRGVAP